MKLDEFIVKNKINIAGQVILMCEAGIEIMRKSKTPNYDERHIFSIFLNLDRFLDEEKGADKSKINFEVLLLAICWHDVWKTKRFPLNLISLLFYQMREGIGSMDMFSQVAEVFGLDKRLIRAVRYAIRKHSSLQFFPIKTLEGRILKDMDSLEEWSLERVKSLKEEYLIFGVMNLGILKLAKFYFDHFMVKDLATSFYFDWSRAEFTKRKEIFLKEANKMLAEYTKIIKK